MHRFLVSRHDLRVAIVTMVAYVVMLRKLLASLLGGWLVIGFMTWGLFSLGCGQTVNIFLFTWYYVNATILSFTLPWQLVRIMRRRPARKLVTNPTPELQPANG